MTQYELRATVRMENGDIRYFVVSVVSESEESAMVDIQRGLTRSLDAHPGATVVTSSLTTHESADA